MANLKQTFIRLDFSNVQSIEISRDYARSLVSVLSLGTDLTEIYELFEVESARFYVDLDRASSEYTVSWFFQSLGAEIPLTTKVSEGKLLYLLGKEDSRQADLERKLDQQIEDQQFNLDREEYENECDFYRCNPCTQEDCPW